jgi:hypothetical protein
MNLEGKDYAGCADGKGFEKVVLKIDVSQILIQILNI